MSSIVLCQYFIQNENTGPQPTKIINNAFVLNKKANIKDVRVSDVKESFPLNPNEYHFRFQK